MAICGWTTLLAFYLLIFGDMFIAKSPNYKLNNSVMRKEGKQECRVEYEGIENGSAKNE